MHDRHELTMADYADDLDWIRQLGWSDADLRRVVVVEEYPAGEESINLSNFGGTSLGVERDASSPTSADARAVPNRWVCRSSTPPELWQRLKDLMASGGPAGYAPGAAGQVDFPPTGRRSDG